MTVEIEMISVFAEILYWTARLHASYLLLGLLRVILIPSLAVNPCYTLIPSSLVDVPQSASVRLYEM